MKSIIVLSLVFAGAAHAQMFKCTNAAGKVEYRGSPCEDSRQARGISGGTVSGIDAMSQTEMQRAVRSGGPERGGPSVTIIGADRTGKPSDQEIRNLETAASSTTIGKKERQFLQAEVERARAAQKEGSYTAEDLQRLKQAQSDQNRIDATDRARARTQAEGTHLRSGSQTVKDEILVDRQIEADRVNARRVAAVAAGAAAAQQAAQAAAAGPTYDRIAQCSGGICRGQSGETYRPFPGVPNSFDSSSGKRCTRGVSGELACY